LVRNLIYPVPDPRFPFLGVHFTRLIHGGIEAGPSAVLAFAREGYRKSDFSARDFIGTLTCPGFWRFFQNYPRVCFDELRRSFSKELFCRSLNALVPDVRPEDLAPRGAGVRAQAIAPNGDTLQDFHFQRRSRAARVERSQPGRHGLARHRTGDREPGRCGSVVIRWVTVIQAKRSSAPRVRPTLMFARFLAGRNRLQTA
jgi:L-2-hydroxyglutarate oxidase LhgO